MNFDELLSFIGSLMKGKFAFEDRAICNFSLDFPCRLIEVRVLFFN